MAAHPAPEDPRLWHLSSVFDLYAHRPYFGDESWGACFANRVYGLPVTVHAHLRITPEGLLLHSDCDRCGAREEVAVDFRMPREPADAELVPVELGSFGGERVRELQRALGDESLRAWAEAHRECEPLPGTLRVPEPIARAVSQLFEYKSAELRERGSAEPSVVAVIDGRDPVWFEVEAAAESDRMLTGFRLRQATGGRPALAVLAAEEVVTGDYSTLRFALLSDSGNWLGEAMIDRFDLPWPGRGVLQPIAWSPLRETATWLDGLRARTRPYPLPRVLPAVNQ